jgi:exodeoxyribonuclease V alpha subunit
MNDEQRADMPAQALAEGLAQHIQRWALMRGADAAAAQLAARAARALSLAISAGHVCLPLAELHAAQAEDGATPGDPDTLRARLLASAVVGTPEAPAALPLLLDGEGRLYLQRHFDYEVRLAQRLMAAAATPPQPIDAAAGAQLHALFGDAGAAPAAVDWQKIAAALALRQRLLVISGGPGTGKTSTVVKLLAALLAQQPGARIALAAPTGKAAARLGEALRQHMALLPPQQRERLPTQAATVHRLLGAHPGGFTHHAGNPLAIDVLVVDEASMLDLALATRLLQAVPAGARIVLLGDKDQLAAVEAGAVFAELSVDPSLSAGCVDHLAALCAVQADAIAPPVGAETSPLRDSVVWFTRNFRFAADSGIARAAADIRQGRSARLLQWLRDDDDAAVRWLDDGGSAPGAASWATITDGYAAFFERLRREPGDVAGVTRAFERFRVLCAQRAGPRGVLALNEALTRHAHAALAAHGVEATRSPWFAGRPVMVLRNDPLLQLFNGDIGIALPAADGTLQVHFAHADGGFRALPPLRLPAHETAFAMTVHKSQGSEFDALLVLLPEQRSRVLSRELLYTAVTRARRQVTLAGSAAVLAAAVDAPTRRHSGLLARLRSAADARG